MFATLSNGKITHYRGDTFREPLYIYEGNKLNFTNYQLKENDSIYFAIMEPHQAFEDAVLKKKYDINSEKDSEGNIIIDLKSKDTQCLLPGTYYYEVKIRKNAQDENESIETIITPTVWWMLGNIPTKTDERESAIQFIINNREILEDLVTIMSTRDLGIINGGTSDTINISRG